MKLINSKERLSKNKKLFLFIPLVHLLMDLFELKFFQFLHLYKLQSMQVRDILQLERLILHKPIQQKKISFLFSINKILHQHKHVFFRDIKVLVVFLQLRPTKKNIKIRQLIFDK